MSIYLKSVGLTLLYTLSLPIQEGFYQTFFETLNISYTIMKVCQVFFYISKKVPMKISKLIYSRIEILSVEKLVV